MLRGILEKERRVKGNFRYCSQIGRRAVTLRGKKKNRIVVLDRVSVRPTHTDVAFFKSKKRITPSLSLPFSCDKPDCRYDCLTPAGNLDSKLGLSHLWPPCLTATSERKGRSLTDLIRRSREVCHDRTLLSNLSRKRNSRKGLNKVNGSSG